MSFVTIFFIVLLFIKINFEEKIKRFKIISFRKMIKIMIMIINLYQIQSNTLNNICHFLEFKY
jgi:hypothetical protein